MQPDMVLQNFGHQNIHSTPRRSQQHQNIGAIMTIGAKGAFDRIHLASNALRSIEQLRAFSFRMAISSFFLKYPMGVYYES
jgi:hypothetical protein